MISVFDMICIYASFSYIIEPTTLGQCCCVIALSNYHIIIFALIVYFRLFYVSLSAMYPEVYLF